MIEYVLQLAFLILALGTAAKIGVRRGQSDERLRCLGLAQTAMLKRWSPTVRWIMAGIDSGRDELPPAEGYVELDPTKTRGCNACGAPCVQCTLETLNKNRNGT